MKNLLVRGLGLVSLFAISLSASTSLVGCAEEEAPAAAPTDPESGEEDLKNTEKNGKKSSQWIYTGVLPALEQPTIDTSLKAHTVRLTGLLPKGFNTALPFYIKPTIEGDRTRVTIVYPIATGAKDPSTGKAPAAPGTYNGLTVSLYPPTTDKAPWGGFPFAAYHTGRGIAFHGPITSVYNPTVGDYEWQLIRGPVSHGCNRMQGEHVVEMIHAIGGNMRVPHKSSDRIDTDFPVRVFTEFDKIGDKFVDVDYPAQAAVKRPDAAERILFPTWDSRDFPSIVCAYDKNRPVDDQHCKNQGADRRDILTGAKLNEPAPVGPFVGTACSTDADCGFSNGANKGVCIAAGTGKYCSVACEGYCPDKTGFAGTFCATSADGKAGLCQPKAEARNQDCAALAGTKPVRTARFVGTSAASPAEASVCKLVYQHVGAPVASGVREPPVSRLGGFRPCACRQLGLAARAGCEGTHRGPSLRARPRHGARSVRVDAVGLHVEALRASGVDHLLSLLRARARRGSAWAADEGGILMAREERCARLARAGEPAFVLDAAVFGNEAAVDLELLADAAALSCGDGLRRRSSRGWRLWVGGACVRGCGGAPEEADPEGFHWVPVPEQVAASRT